MEEQYITFDEFVSIAGVGEKTIKKRQKDIPGLVYEDNQFTVLSGTRYPCDLHRYKINNSADRRYVLLKTISEYKYISHVDLRVYHEQFVDLLRELLEAGLIRENHLSNHYGANAYDCTEKGDLILKRKKSEALKEIADTIASATGHFVGSVISEMAI